MEFALMADVVEYDEEEDKKDNPKHFQRLQWNRGRCWQCNRTGFLGTVCETCEDNEIVYESFKREKDDAMKPEDEAPWDDEYMDDVAAIIQMSRSYDPDNADEEVEMKVATATEIFVNDLERGLRMVLRRTYCELQKGSIYIEQQVKKFVFEKRGWFNAMRMRILFWM